MAKINTNTQDRMRRIKNTRFDFCKQPKTNINICNLCGSSLFCVITRLDRYEFKNKACICYRCGLVFLNPVMTLDSYREFYKDTYRKLVFLPITGKRSQQTHLNRNKQMTGWNYVNLLPLSSMEKLLRHFLMLVVRSVP